MSHQEPDARASFSKERARNNAKIAVVNLQNAINPAATPEPLYDWSDPDALAANKRGEITPSQNRMLDSARAWKNLAGCLLGMLGLVVALPAIVGSIIERQSSLLGYGAGILVICGLIWAITAHAATQIDRDVAASNIAHASGEVVWRGNRYVPIINGRRLRIADKRYGSPHPGPHEMSYLGKTGYLLTAIPLLVSPQETRDPTLSPAPQAFLSSSEPARLALLRAVTAANGFRLHALVKNRAGVMTVGQRWRLFRSLHWTVVAFLLQILLALAIIITPFLARENHADPGVIGVVILVGGGMTLLAYTVIRNSQSLYWHVVDLMRGRLAVQEASVTRDMDIPQGEDELTQYYYEAPDLRFLVSRAGYDALIPHILYRLCYTPKTKTLMNIEPLATEPHMRS